MLPLCRWSSHMHTSQSSLRPSEHLETRMCSATNELSRYTVTIYKTWGQRACTSRLDRFALSPQVSISSVQSLSHVQLFATPWIAARQSSLSITNSRNLLKLTPIQSAMPSSHLILCRPLLLLPPNPSQHQGLFQWVNSSHEVAKVLEFQLQHQSFQWTPRTDLL